MNETNNFIGFYGIGFREMNDAEFLIHCSNTSSNSSSNEIKPLYHSGVEFQSGISWRGFTANCIYFDRATKDWSSDGVEMLDDTNHEYTHW